jgi:hypothetical protein
MLQFSLEFTSFLFPDERVVWQGVCQQRAEVKKTLKGRESGELQMTALAHEMNSDEQPPPDYGQLPQYWRRKGK